MVGQQQPLLIERILVVEEDSGTREALRDILAASGFLVGAASSCEQALAAFRHQSYDAAVVGEVGRPNLSSLDFLRAIRTSSPDTQIIVVSGGTLLKLVGQSFDRTAFAYLGKPVDPEQLLATLGRALDHRRADETLWRSEEELTDLFDNVAIGIHWIGPDGYVLRVNQAELDMLGYAREEYVGRHIADFHADREVIDDILRRLGRNETLRNHEARLRAKDGSIKHGLISANVRWRDGKFVHSRCFTRDVTARKRADGVLQALVDVGRELAGTLDPNQSTRQIVSTVLGLFDVRRAALYELEASSGALRCVAIAGEGDPTVWIGQRMPRGTGLAGHAVHASKPVWTSDLVADRRFSLPEWLLIRLWEEGLRAAAAVPLNDRGTTLGVLTLADVPGRVFGQDELRVLGAFANHAAVALRNARLHEEVRLARDFLQSIAENSVDAIVTTGTDGRLTYVSPGAEEMFGYRAEEVLERPLSSFYRGGQAEAAALARRLRMEGRVRDYATAIRARDGRCVPVSASVSLLRDRNGAVIGTLGELKDMTERERGEAARRDVAELRAVTLLARGVAHEINNPLTAIVGQLEMLSGATVADSQEARRVATALAGAERIRDIVARMGRITRIATTKEGNLTSLLDIQQSSTEGAP